MSDRLADARRGRINEARSEVRAESATADGGIDPTEASMHALSLLEGGVSDFDATGQGIGAAGRKRTEVHNDRQERRDRRPFQVNRGDGKSAGDGPRVVRNEEPADIVLSG
jgi:hypothetical protein